MAHIIHAYGEYIPLKAIDCFQGKFGIKLGAKIGEITYRDAFTHIISLINLLATVNRECFIKFDKIITHLNATPYKDQEAVKELSKPSSGPVTCLTVILALLYETRDSVNKRLIKGYSIEKDEIKVNTP